MVEVHYGEGVAIHTGPEPCVGPREGSGEASAGERAGWPLSRERATVPGADVVIPEPISSDPWQSMENQPFLTIHQFSTRPTEVVRADRLGGF